MTASNSPIDEQPEEETDETGEGYVYIIENDAFEIPVVKIGKAKNLSQRINTLNTAVPLPFTCKKASLVKDMNEVEKFLHKTFRHAKHHWRGEFFQIESDVVAGVLRLLEIEDATHLAPQPTTEEVDSINTANRRRNDRFNFEMVGIRMGEQLRFVGDESIEVEVANNKTLVRYDGQEHSISGLAKALKGTSYSLNDTLYWMYGDETLQGLRNRLETQENNDDSE